jgi:hypothetical protein
MNTQFLGELIMRKYRFGIPLLVAILFCFSPVWAGVSGKCKDSDLIKFTWEWCDSKGQPPIKNVCFGSVIYEDTVYQTVQIEVAEADENSYFECLFDIDWQESTLQNCARAVERTYLTAFGEKKTTKIKECLVDGALVWIEGFSLSGHPFYSRNPHR